MRLTSAMYNVQDGMNTYIRSAQGAVVDETSLLLAATAAAPAWGIWSWGKFADGNKPLVIEVELVNPDNQQVWLMLSDYATGRWDIIGFYQGEQIVYPYENNLNYISDPGYTYVGLLVEGSNSVEVVSLNLHTDNVANPPVAPQNLEATDITHNGAMLTWDPVEDEELAYYRLYSGPSPGFLPGQNEVVLEEELPKFVDFHGLVGLAENTTYHYRISGRYLDGSEGPLSNTATFTTESFTELEIPQNLVVDDVGSSWIDLSWDPVSAAGLIGYEVYTGPHADFGRDDTGVTKAHAGVIEDSSWRMTDLMSATQYHIRVLAYYQSGSSEFSNTVSPTTLSSTPPTPAFTYDPPDVTTGITVSFDPGGTTDPDSPLEELIFKWDMDSDGDYEIVTTGPEVVNYAFTKRGTSTVTLTVTDGTPVEISEDIFVGVKFETNISSWSEGSAGTVLAVDAEYGSMRSAALMLAGGEPLVAYDDGISSQLIPSVLPEVSDYLDIQLSQDGVLVLIADVAGGSVDWEIQEYSGGWSQLASGSVAADDVAAGRIVIDENSRYTVGIVAVTDNGGSDDYSLHAYHENDGATITEDSYGPTSNQLTLQLHRSNDVSYFVFTEQDEVYEWQLSDSVDQLTSLQQFATDILQLNITHSETTPANVSWTTLLADGAVGYGDNYGAANQGTQVTTPDDSVTRLAGLIPGADNEVVAFWTARPGSDMDAVQSYDTADGTLTELAAGFGLATEGYADTRSVDATAEVLTVFDETRDGECTEWRLWPGTAEAGDAIYTPAMGLDAEIGTRHQVLPLTNGIIELVSQQSFPICRTATTGNPTGSFTYEQIGIANYLYPDLACPTRLAGERMFGTFTQNDTLITYHYRNAYPSSSREEYFQGVSAADLVYNPYDQSTHLVYVTDGGTELVARKWGGLSWNDPVTVHTSASPIRVVALAPSLEPKVGVAFADAGGNIWFAETLDGVWQGAELIGSMVVNESAGIDAAYHTNGSLAVTLEANDTNQGIMLGVKPDSGTTAWELVSATDGNTATGLHVFFQLASPVCLYYQPAVPVENSRLQFIEHIDGAWTTTELDGDIHGEPITASLFGIGHIIIGGYATNSGNRRATLGSIYR